MIGLTLVVASREGGLINSIQSPHDIFADFPTKKTSKLRVWEVWAQEPGWGV